MLGGQAGRLRCRSVALLVSPSRAVPRYGALFNGLPGRIVKTRSSRRPSCRWSGLLVAPLLLAAPLFVLGPAFLPGRAFLPLLPVQFAPLRQAYLHGNDHRRVRRFARLLRRVHPRQMTVTLERLQPGVWHAGGPRGGPLHPLD